MVKASFLSYCRSHRWPLSVLHAPCQADLPDAGLHGWSEEDLRPPTTCQLVSLTLHNPTPALQREMRSMCCLIDDWLGVCGLVRYPEARAIQRKVVFHAGPTNSGKTYHAIQRYLAAKSGVYCGPLKLLAHEIFEKSNTAVRIGLLPLKSVPQKKWECIFVTQRKV